MINLVRSTGATLEAIESGEEGNSPESGTQPNMSM
jgi:hypothetical protein